MKSRLPGFTAEASLSATRSEYYTASVAQEGGGHAQHVMPQLRFVWKPIANCNPDCACFTWENCPCCIGPGPGGGGPVWLFPGLGSFASRFGL
jgi:hypothetical protein